MAYWLVGAQGTDPHTVAGKEMENAKKSWVELDIT